MTLKRKKGILIGLGILVICILIMMVVKLNSKQEKIVLKDKKV